MYPGRGAGTLIDVITVAIAEAHRLYAAGLDALLDGEPGIDVVGWAADGPELEVIGATLHPNVVIADLALPDLEDAVFRLHTQRPRSALLLLGSAEGGMVGLSQALTWRAKGYLYKDTAPDALVGAVRDLAADRQVFDPALVAAAMRRGSPSTPSARELSTLRLVADGLTSREIAVRLSLSPGTVRNYVSSVIAKTNARNRVDAVRIARERSWI